MNIIEVLEVIGCIVITFPIVIIVALAISVILGYLDD